MVMKKLFLFIIVLVGLKSLCSSSLKAMEPEENTITHYRQQWDLFREQKDWGSAAGAAGYAAKVVESVEDANIQEFRIARDLYRKQNDWGSAAGYAAMVIRPVTYTGEISKDANIEDFRIARDIYFDIWDKNLKTQQMFSEAEGYAKEVLSYTEATKSDYKKICKLYKKHEDKIKKKHYKEIMEEKFSKK